MVRLPRPKKFLHISMSINLADKSPEKQGGNYFMDLTKYQVHKVPITEEDTQKSYFKYYLEDMTPPSPEAYQAMRQIRPDQALPFKDRNRLFEPGYMDAEVGFTILPDGTGYLANLTRMPGVTAEMFDWWFAWHSLDNLRYTLWNPDDHYQAENMNRVHAMDESLSYRERLWNCSHDIIEDTGMGPAPIVINFKYPGDIGFDDSKIGTEACATIVCGLGYGKGQPPFAMPDTVMCHFVREIPGGIELRSRFWMGWTYKNGKDVKALPDGIRMPIMGPMSLAMHNVKEFTNLAALLPRIFPEEKDNF